jgi:hypothetical protein
MTIAKGQPWGEQGPLIAGAAVVAGDDALADLVTERRRRGEPLGEVGLLAGDLWRTVGGLGDRDRLRSPEASRLLCDVLRVDGLGEPLWAVAHVIVRRSWWFGEVTAVMNAQYRGDWDVAPRSHPNDGKADVVSGSPPLAERWKARARLSAGMHVPHPAITERRVSEITIERSGRSVWLDGRRVVTGAARLTITVEPDALTIVV